MAKKKIPCIKKTIEAFLTSEEGKISKKSALDLGIKVAFLSLLLSRVVTPKKIDAFTSHVSCHANCHGQHTSCHGQHTSCHGQHTSCHSQCYIDHGDCHTQHTQHSQHVSCHWAAACVDEFCA